MTAVDAGGGKEAVDAGGGEEAEKLQGGRVEALIGLLRS